MAKLLPVLLALIGLAGGGGAGFLLRPPPAEDAAAADHAEPAKEEAPAEDHEAPAHEYVKLNNQFIVPLVEGGEMSALVILSLSLEVSPGMGTSVHDREPKLRDAFLQVLFAHANAGGFRGAFTENTTLTSLRTALLETAQKVSGTEVTDVLIGDLVRQDS